MALTHTCGFTGDYRYALNETEGGGMSDLQTQMYSLFWAQWNKGGVFSVEPATPEGEGDLPARESPLKRNETFTLDINMLHATSLGNGAFYDGGALEAFTLEHDPSIVELI